MKKLIILIFLFGVSLSWATNHYVDKNASGSNNGTNWANAWTSLSAINWSSVNPGDIIYVSGGTDSTIYYGGVTISDNGTADNRITIRNSWEAGHNGRVILDGNWGNVTVYFNGAQYITIKGFEIRNATFPIHIQYQNTGVTIDSCLVYDWTSFGLRAAENNNGLLTGTIVENCDFINSKSFGDDALLFNTVDDVTIRNNFIHIRNAQHHNSHIDGMLAMISRDFKVYNNIVVLDSNAQGQSYILRLASDASLNDSVIVYNNFFYAGGIWESEQPPHTSVVNLRYQSSDGAKPTTYFAHNTVVSWGAWYSGMVYETFRTTAVNNIIAQFGDGIDVGQATFWPANQRGTDAPPVDSVRNNLIWREFEANADQTLFTGSWDGNGTSRSSFNWSTWVNVLGGTGINANPLFVDTFAHSYEGGDNQGENQANITGKLQATSPAISAGEDVKAIIESLDIGGWVDIGERNPNGLGVLPGNPRNESPDSVTIGAYNPPWLR